MMYSFDIEKLLALFDEYCTQYVSDKSSGTGHLASEIRTRIKQVDLLTRKVMECESEITAVLVQELQTKNLKMHEHKVFEMTTTVECCLYIAHRLITTIRSLTDLGWSDFSCNEISDVRNQLLAHPREGLFGRSFSWGMPNGPAIKAVRTETNKYLLRDKGLYFNVNMMFTRLQERLELLLKHDVPTAT